jgi:hypothetical protein
MKNIYILPTEKQSILYAKDDNYKLANSTMAMDWYISSVGYRPYNIYITSDEKIKEGDWFLNIKSGAIGQHNGAEILLFKDDRKIILTTDRDLNKDGVQAIDDEFLEWFVKNPSCEYVSVEYNEYEMFGNKSKKWIDSHNSYEIIVPKEEPKQETLEELKKRFANDKSNKDIDLDYQDGIYYGIGEPHFTYDGGSTGKSIRDMKIILRPFSDITKEIEVNGEKFVPSEKIGIHLFDYDFMYIYRKETNGIPFWVVQKLLEWNFDLYGLIESDNAININTL